MYKDKQIIALIPARGGSKGLPKKNIKNLCGKPLVAWTIESALKSKYLDDIIVSTDDNSIVKISKKYGANVPFIRPKEFALDETPMIDVIEHTINFFRNTYNKKFNYLVLLEPTSPLRKKNDIDNAIISLIENEETADSLVSLGLVHLEHPNIIKKIDKKGYVKNFIEQKLIISRRQELFDVYFPYGVIYMSKVETLISEKNFYQERTIPYFIERWQNYEIDDDIDFICVKALIKEKKEEL